MAGWGIGHTSRFVLEQMFNGHFGSADPTASITENGEARRHRWNWMHQKRDDLGGDEAFVSKGPLDGWLRLVAFLLVSSQDHPKRVTLLHQMPFMSEETETHAH